MTYTIIYYKRACGTWVFFDYAKRETLVLNDVDGARHHLQERWRGNNLWRLYLDLPDDFDTIRRNFFTPSYWENRTWQEEDQA